MRKRNVVAGVVAALLGEGLMHASRTRPQRRQSASKARYEGAKPLTKAGRKVARRMARRA